MISNKVHKVLALLKNNAMEENNLCKLNWL